MAKKILFLYLFLLLIFVATPPVLGSGGGYFRVWFIDPNHPSPPLAEFLDGELGVIETSLEGPYLVVAYRHLRGLGVDGETKAVLADLLDPQGRYEYEPGQNAWQERRRQAGRSRSYISTNREPLLDENGRWIRGYFVNCNDDAFATAAATYDERLAQYGEGSPELDAWLNAQETVFSNCREGESIPQELPVGAPVLARQDRDYQIAAAYFYATDYEEAERRFLAMGSDAGSPWQPWGRYLAARAMIRSATVGDAGRERLPAAQEFLERLLAEETEAESLARARRLLGYVRFRTEPEDYRLQLATALVAPVLDASLPQQLEDFLRLATGWAVDEEDPCFARGSTPSVELMGWISCQGAAHLAGPEAAAKRALALEGSLERYRQALAEGDENGSVLWLVGALMLAQGDEGSNELLAAAATIPASSPASATAAYHRVRLLIERGQDEEAREALDALLAEPRSRRYRNDENRWLELRGQVAQSFDELLRFSVRKPVTNAYYEGVGGPWRVPADPQDLDNPLLTARVTEVLEQHFGPRDLLALLDRPELPEGMRPYVATRAWSLAVVLGDAALANQLAPRAQQLVPGLATDLSEYTKASPSAAPFAAAMVFLRSPGLGVTLPSPDYGLRSQALWCAADWGRVASGEEEPLPGDSDGTSSEAARQLLRSLPPLTEWIEETVFSWATQQPDDPRLPEALHRLVRVTRVSYCRDGELSHRAFNLLHRRYPKSEWAESTPFWYQ